MNKIVIIIGRILKIENLDLILTPQIKANIDTTIPKIRYQIKPSEEINPKTETEGLIHKKQNIENNKNPIP